LTPNVKRGGVQIFNRQPRSGVRQISTKEASNCNLASV
jgi:hypothetical protein